MGDTRNRKKRLAAERQIFTPMSDRMISQNLGGEMATSINPSSGFASMVPGMQVLSDIMLTNIIIIYSNLI